MADILVCAKYFIKKIAENRYPPITHLKLQKLLYYAQVYSLVKNGQRLFNEDFQAWIHGPVSPTVYGAYRNYSKHVDLSLFIKVSDVELYGLSYNDRCILDAIVDSYGRLSGQQLEFLSHREEPWREARVGLKPWQPCDRPIKIENIIKFYGFPKK